MKVTIGVYGRHLLRMSLSNGPIRVGAGLEHKASRVIAGGDAAPHQVCLLLHYNLMIVPHLISFLHPI